VNWSAIPYAASGANAAITSASALTAVTALASINGGQIAGFRNRIINGDMRINQRFGTSNATLVAAAAPAYIVDRFYAACTGANLTIGRTAGVSPQQYIMQATGAASVTGIRIGQLIESTNIYDLAGQTATFSAEISNSLLTTVTWTAYYANAVDDFSAKTQIATGTFTVSGAPTVYSTQIALPANTVNGIAIELSVGAQTSGAFKVGRWQLEAGSVATTFERLPINVVLPLVQRYYEKSFALETAPVQNAGANTGEAQYTAHAAGAVAQRAPTISFAVTKRIAPTTLTLYNPVAANSQIRDAIANADCSASGFQAINSTKGIVATCTGNASTAAGNRLIFHWTADAELVPS
jgi:hypothetical protein